VFGPAGGPGVG
jgi:hypothetical protein